jgi:enamine deaminase RidA (YjgF/YER057c/UK114 family)
MRKAIINPTTLVRPAGFSHGILVSGARLLFLAGQTASDGKGNIIAPGDLVSQYEQVLRNLQAVVETAGGRMQDIAQITIFVRDRDEYHAHLKPLGKVHKAFFGAYYPATALLEISRFFQDEALIEIQGLAVLDAEGDGQ